MGLAPGVLAGHLVGGPEGLDTHGILRAAAEGKISCLVLVGADPLADFPDRDLAKRGLAGAAMVISVDTHPNESNRNADIVFPAAAFAEKSGTTTNLEGRVSSLAQKVTPPGTCRADWMIAAELAFRLGGDLGLESAADAWTQLAATTQHFAGCSAGTFSASGAADGLVLPLPVTAVMIGDTDQSSDPAEVESPQPATVAEEQASVVFKPPGSATRPAPLDAFSLRLVSQHELYDSGVGVQHASSMAKLPRGAVLRLNPHDFDRLGVKPGERVRATSSRTSVVLEVSTDSAVPRGSASLAFNQPGVAAADLIDANALTTDVRLETIA